MSKFIDRLKQVFQSAPQQLGFRAANNVSSRPRIQLVVNLYGSARTLAKHLTVADALCLSGSQHGNSEIVWGVRLDKGVLEEANQAKEAGADFVILPASGTVLPPAQEIGKILQVESSITDVLLRTLNELPLDAVLLEEKESESGLTWQRLMLIHRFVSILSKPVLISIPLSTKADELQLIWEAGMSGVVVEVSSESDAAELKNLRQVIDGLSFHHGRNWVSSPLSCRISLKRLRKQSLMKTMTMTTIRHGKKDRLTARTCPQS